MKEPVYVKITLRCPFYLADSFLETLISSFLPLFLLQIPPFSLMFLSPQSSSELVLGLFFTLTLLRLSDNMGHNRAAPLLCPCPLKSPAESAFGQMAHRAQPQ